MVSYVEKKPKLKAIKKNVDNKPNIDEVKNDVDNNKMYQDELNRILGIKAYNLMVILEKKDDDNQEYNLVDVIIGLGNNYNYTEAELDKILTIFIYNKRTSYLVSESSGKYWNYHYNNDTNFQKYKEQVINIIFSKLKPSDKQLRNILACYSFKMYPHGKSFMWVEILLKNGFKFTGDQMAKLINAGCSNDVFINFVDITYEDFKNIFSDWNKRDFDKEKYKKTFNKFKNEIDVDYLNSCLNRVNNGNIYDYYHKLDLNLMSILELIFSNGVVPNEETTKIIMNKRIMIPSIIWILIKNQLYITQDFLIFLFGIEVLLEIGIWAVKNIKDIKLTNEILNSNYISTFEGPYDQKTIRKKPNNEQLISFLKESNYTDEEINKLVKIEKEIIEKEVIEEEIIEEVFDEEELEEEVVYKEVYKPKQIKDTRMRYINIFDLFVHFGAVPTNITLNKACIEKDSYVFDILTQKYNILPTKQNLDNCIYHIMSASDEEIKFISKILCYRIQPDSLTLKNINIMHYEAKFDALVQLLLSNGLNISFNDVVALIRKKKKIDDLERFRIDYDEKLYYYCYIYGYFPECYKKNFNSPSMKLRDLCTNRNLTFQTLSQYMKDNNVQLDRYCFENLCRASLWDNICQELIDLGCKPTINTLYYLGVSGFNPKMEIVNSLNGVDYNYMCQKYEIK